MGFLPSNSEDLPTTQVPAIVNTVYDKSIFKSKKLVIRILKRFTQHYFYFVHIKNIENMYNFCII